MKNPNIKFDYLSIANQIKKELLEAMAQRDLILKKYGVELFVLPGEKSWNDITPSEVDFWGMAKIEEIISSLQKAEKAAKELSDAVFVASTTAPSPQ